MQNSMLTSGQHPVDRVCVYCGPLLATEPERPATVDEQYVTDRNSHVRRSVTKPTQTIGTHLRQIRESRDWSLRDVEKLTDGKLRSGYLSQVETGQIVQPSPAALEKLAGVYGQDYATLLAWAGYSMPTQTDIPVHVMAMAYTIGNLSEEESEELQFVVQTWLALRGKARDAKTEPKQRTKRLGKR